MIEFEQASNSSLGIASIKVIGIGGAGGNTVNSMIEANDRDIEFIVANTDSQALLNSKAPNKIQLGIKSTKGLGTGANPEIGRRAAEEDLDQILDAMAGADIVFIAAGMGGGTGSGASPVIARALREQGILTVAVVTKPFLFEGKRRARIAEETIQQLRAEVDTMIILPNQKLLEYVGDNVTMIDAFAMINDVLNKSVRNISDIIIRPGHINVDFADLKTIMKDMGIAVMGTGIASGPDRAFVAAMNAISSPLLENVDIRGARGVLLNITGGPDLTLHEINAAASVIYEQADEFANIIIGSVIDHNMHNEISVAIVATGFDKRPQSQNSVTVAPAQLSLSTENFRHESVSCENIMAATSVTSGNSDSTSENNSSLDSDDLDIPAFLRRKSVVQTEQPSQE